MISKERSAKTDMVPSQSSAERDLHPEEALIESQASERFSPHVSHDPRLLPSPNLLHLQRTIGNRQVQRLFHTAPLATARIQRQSVDPIAQGYVRFAQFINQGTGLTGRQLGPTDATTYRMNGVELQFKISPEAKSKYNTFEVRQWSGPEAIWSKSGNPLTSPWRTIKQGPGTGSDNPEPQNVAILPDTIAYFDSPGPNLGPYVIGPENSRASRIYVVQNFTGWIIGTPRAGGAAVNLCAPVAWYSIIHLANANWSTPEAGLAWDRMYLSGSGTGWRDAAAPPSL